MLEINDTIIVEVFRDNAPPPPPIPYTTPLAGAGGGFSAQRPSLIRKFLINNSDYSDYVAQWPTLVSKWDDARPRDVKMKLVNKDHHFNAFFSDRPKLNSSCHIDLGYENITAIEVSSGSQLEMYNASIVKQGDKTFSFHVAIDSGTYGSQPKTFYRTADTESNSGYLEIYKNSSNYLGLEYIAPGGSTTTLEASPNSYTFLPGRFHHVCAQVSSSYFALWSDAILVNSVASSTGIVWAYDPSLYAFIGGEDTEGSFRIAELRVHTELIHANYISDLRVGLDDYINKNHFKNYHRFQLNFKDEIHGYDANALGNISFAYGPEYLTPTMQTVFRGRLDGFTYDESRVTLELIDALHPLVETKMGAPNSPIQYTNAMPSDIAMTAITQYAALTRATYVDSDSFYKWAEVFSSNNVRVGANFTGQRPSQVLREIAQMTQSAIYITHADSNTFIRFNLFSELGSASLTLNEDLTLDSEAKLNTDNVINYQYVLADYDQTSNYHKTEVLARDTVSAGQYGFREDKRDSTNLWFVGSISASYFANRSIAMNKDPIARFTITTGLSGLVADISDTIIISDNMLDAYGGNVSKGYRVLGRSINLDEGTVKFEATEAGGLFTDATPFRLNYSALDGTDVLL